MRNYNDQKTIVFAVVYVFLIIISLIILIKFQKLPNNQTSIHSKAAEYMQNLNVYNYDEYGLLKNFITADSWSFLPNNNCSIIEKPYAIIYKKTDNNSEQLIYTISGQLAHAIHQPASNKIELFKLWDNIQINQTNNHNTKKNSGFNLTTSYLTFDPNTEQANTNQFVTISRPGLLLSGVGKTANLKNNQLELHKKTAIKFIKN